MAAFSKNFALEFVPPSKVSISHNSKNTPFRWSAFNWFIELTLGNKTNGATIKKTMHTAKKMQNTALIGLFFGKTKTSHKILIFYARLGVIFRENMQKLPWRLFRLFLLCLPIVEQRR